MSEVIPVKINGKTLEEVIEELQNKYNIVGREVELKLALAAKLAKKAFTFRGRCRCW